MERQREVNAIGKTIAQAYIEEGEVIGALKQSRMMLVRLAKKRLNSPDEPTIKAIEAITDLARLARMLDQHAEVATWADLLAIE